MFRKTTLVFLVILLFAGISMAAETIPKVNGKDYGKEPWIVDIEEETVKNKNFLLSRNLDFCGTCTDDASLEAISTALRSQFFT